MSPKGNHTMPRVLVIDDQPGVRATISLVLQAEGFEVTAVESGQLGLSEFHNSYFDLVIVDIFMPEMDGVKLIKALRARIPTQPVMAISGVQLRASGRTALDLFAMAPELSSITCLQKPFRPRELLQAVLKALAVAA
jgi:CheY-like chemotaxis protein